MKTLSHDDLSQLSQDALASPRLRMNANLHTDLADPIQRLAIAMAPQTYIRPHRHTHTWELLSPLRGRFVVLCFNDEGDVTERLVLGEQIATLELDEGAWHTVCSLDVGGIILEVKRGPYTPFREEDFAPWSNAPGAETQQAFIAWCRHAEKGQRWLSV